MYIPRGAKNQERKVAVPGRPMVLNQGSIRGHLATSRDTFCHHSQSTFFSIWWTKVKDAALTLQCTGQLCQKKIYYLAQNVNYDKVDNSGLDSE